MERLVLKLMENLDINEERAVEILLSIAEYIEIQHPVLHEITQEILKSELETHS